MSAVSWSEISARLFLHLNIGLKGVGGGGGGVTINKLTPEQWAGFEKVTTTDCVQWDGADERSLY